MATKALKDFSKYKKGDEIEASKATIEAWVEAGLVSSDAVKAETKKPTPETESKKDK